MQLDRLAALAVLWLALAPAAAAGPVEEAQEIADEAVAYAEEAVAIVGDELLACTVADPRWAAACSSGASFVGCGADPEAAYRCRVLFQGSGGDLDGSAVPALQEAALAAAAGVPGRTSGSAANLTSSGLNAATVAISEADGWLRWSAAQASGLTALALQAKQPYQDTAEDVARSVQNDSLAFVQDSVQDASAALIAFASGALSRDFRATVAADSGPVTLMVTNERPADDPCSPGTGTGIFGSDCRGDYFVDADARASLGCNAYTTIGLPQPCGGFVSRDWTWAAQGSPGPGLRARLTIGADNSAQVHDATGVLHCNSPTEHGYWMQSAYVDVSGTLFKEGSSFGQENANSVEVFGHNAGDCRVEPWGDGGHRITYDVVFNGVPMRATGTFQPEGMARNLLECEAGADTRPPHEGGCDGAVYLPGGDFP